MSADTRPDQTPKRKPTPLDVYLECLHLIQELPAGDRPRVVTALSNFATFGEKLLTCPGAES
jgi:hypothetical protein